jgi:hypothetical protein
MYRNIPTIGSGDSRLQDQHLSAYGLLHEDSLSALMDSVSAAKGALSIKLSKSSINLHKAEARSTSSSYPMKVWYQLSRGPIETDAGLKCIVLYNDESPEHRYMAWATGLVLAVEARRGVVAQYPACSWRVLSADPVTDTASISHATS